MDASVDENNKVSPLIDPFTYPLSRQATFEELIAVVEAGNKDALETLVKPNKYGFVQFSPNTSFRYCNYTVPLWQFCMIKKQFDCFEVLLQNGLDIYLVDPHQRKFALEGAGQMAYKYNYPQYLKSILVHRGVDCLKTLVYDYDKNGFLAGEMELADKIRKANLEQYNHLSQFITDMKIKEGASDLLNCQFFF